MEQQLICRTCLSNTSKCISIYTMPSYCGKSFTISKMIMACAPVEISEDDGLPSKICDNCLKQLQVSFMFRIRVLQANQKLKDYVRTKLVPNLQPVSEGFIEPLVLPPILDENIKELFSWEQVLQQSNDNKSDPLIVDPLAKLIEQTGIKTESEYEIFPIEEVMLPTNSDDFLAEKTDELQCAISSITAESESVVSERNSNLLNGSPPTFAWTNNSANNQQQNNSNLDSNVLHLTETDTNVIQNILQNIQSNQSGTNAKYILIKANQTNSLTAANNKQIDPKINNLPSTSQSSLQSATFNANFKNWKKQSFEDELKKFVEDRQKYLESRQDAFCFSATRNTNSRKIIENIIGKTHAASNRDYTKIANCVEKPCTTKRKHTAPPSSIDLTSDDDISRDVLRIKPTNTDTNLDTSQQNSDASAFFKGITVRNGENKVVRLMIEEDQSSCIIIDD